MTDVSGEVENNINATDEMVYNIVVTDITANDFHSIGNSVQVELVCPLFRQECVDNDYLNPHFNEGAGKVAADKAHATGNQHGTTVILGTKIVQF